MGTSHAAQRVISTLPEPMRAWFQGKKAFIVKSDGHVIEADWGEGKPTLKQLQGAVSGYIKLVPHGAVVPGWKVICNEEGLLQSLPPNTMAQLLLAEAHYVVGDVVFTRRI